MRILSTIGAFFLAISLFAQSQVELAGSAVLGFNNRQTTVWDVEAEEGATAGYVLQGRYSYRFKEFPVEPVAGLGYKPLFFGGRAGESSYSGTTHKFIGSLGGRYWHNEFWSARLALGFENNRDFEDFRSQTSDNFRYSVVGEILHRWSNGLGVSLSYTRALYPLVDRYLIFNPANFVAVGINYRIL